MQGEGAIYAESDSINFINYYGIDVVNFLDDHWKIE